MHVAFMHPHASRILVHLAAVLRSCSGCCGCVCGLQEGAEMRDQETMAYRDALLQLAEDLETQEREEAARVAEASRIAAEARRLEEMRRCGCAQCSQGGSSNVAQQF